jgi:hypothetical protein
MWAPTVGRRGARLSERQPAAQLPLLHNSVQGCRPAHVSSAPATTPARHARRRIVHRISQITASAPMSASANTPAMIFARVAMLEISTRRCDRSGHIHNITAMQPFSNKSRLAMRDGYCDERVTHLQRQRCLAQVIWLRRQDE